MSLGYEERTGMLQHLNRISVLWALLGGTLLMTIVFITAINVTAFTLNKFAQLFGETISGLPGYEDFIRLAISCAVPMFFPYCQLKRGHVTVDIFTYFSSPQVQSILDRTAQIMMIIITLFLSYWMILGGKETYSDGVLSRVLGWPEWPFYIPGILSLLLWALVATAQLFTNDSNG